VLLGAVTGLVLAAAFRLFWLAPEWQGRPSPIPDIFVYGAYGEKHKSPESGRPPGL